MTKRSRSCLENLFARFDFVISTNLCVHMCKKSLFYKNNALLYCMHKIVASKGVLKNEITLSTSQL